MGEKLDGFSLLLDKVTIYMKEHLKYSESYIDRYKYGWRRIRFYLSIKNYSTYKAKYEADLCYFLFKDKNIRSYSDNERLAYRSVKQLSEFVSTGKITGKTPCIPQDFIFEGDVGNVIKEFWDMKMSVVRSPSRMFYSLVGLRAFYLFCKEKSIVKFSDIEVSFLLKFISQIHESKYANVNINFPMLKQLFKYAFEKRILTEDFSCKIPLIRSLKIKQLPSVYKPDEISALLNSIDRNSKNGKRNYAIILLAAILGIRASDIANLKFENLDWVKSEINFIQMKTLDRLSLPLLPDIGNAIIDYLKYSRPISNHDYLFLSCRQPIVPFSRGSVIGHIVKRAFIKAGIDISSRKSGAHSLRHSVASRLLERKINYPVISEILGHKDSRSTMVYLRIDLKSMEIFITEVPKISNDFYQQGGGIFYV